MKQTGELTVRLLLGFLGYPLQFSFHALSVTEHSTCLLANGYTDVAPFPPAALPAFIGTIAPSDSPIPVCLSPFIIDCPAYSHPCKRFQGLPGSHVFTMSDMPCSMTPGKLHRLAFVRRLCVDFRYPNGVILPLFYSISRLNHFNLAAYDLPSCCPTLNHKRLPPWVQGLATWRLARPSGAGFAPAKTRDLARPH